MLKFPVNSEIVTIRSAVLVPEECTTIVAENKGPPPKTATRSKNSKIVLHPDFPDQEVAIGGTLSKQGRADLCALLKRNLDVFCMATIRHDGEEKGLGPRAYQGYSGGSPEVGGSRNYAQSLIPRLVVQPDHGEKARWLVDKAFDKQIGQNLEVYVDDLVIKSHNKDELLRDIEETFCTLRQINMKLNPKKCTFDATKGMFLGYMISPKGTKPCPEKTEAVLQLPSPRTIKEVQSLNGKLAGLNRFLSKSMEKSLPLFKTLKRCIKKSDFRWTAEADEAFKHLK
ncbi:reverse transcriptase domain-containing protein [Tanacetum coccineum]